MKNVLILLLLVTYGGHAQISRAKRPKEIARTLCDSFTEQYASYESHNNNRWVYIKTIEVELVNHPPEKQKSIIEKLREYCPAFLEFDKVASTMKTESSGKNNPFRLWETFISNVNETAWSDYQKQRFQKVCNAALDERQQTEALCSCTLDRIMARLSASNYFRLSTKDQGDMAGQVGFVYCSD